MAAHRGIITWLYAQYSYDYRRIVLLNPPVLSVKNVCVGGGVCMWVYIEGISVSGSIMV